MHIDFGKETIQNCQKAKKQISKRTSLILEKSETQDELDFHGVSYKPYRVYLK